MKIELLYNLTKSLFCINPKESQSTCPIDAFTVKVTVPQQAVMKLLSNNEEMWIVKNVRVFFSFTCEILFRQEDEILGICGEVDGSGDFCIKQNKLY